MAVESSDFLKLTNCPRCAYSFEGLSRQGRCPECGLRYNEDMRLLPMVLHAKNTKRRVYFIPIILIIIGVIVIVYELSQGSVSTLPFFYILLGVFIQIASWQAKRWIINWRLRLMKQFDERQLAIFFNSRGLALRKNNRLLTLWSWKCFDKFSLEEVESSVWRLQLRPAHWRPTLAPTFDVDLSLNSNGIASTLRKEITQLLEANGKNLKS